MIYIAGQAEDDAPLTQPNPIVPPADDSPVTGLTEVGRLTAHTATPSKLKPGISQLGKNVQKESAKKPSAARRLPIETPRPKRDTQGML